MTVYVVTGACASTDREPWDWHAWCYNYFLIHIVYHSIRSGRDCTDLATSSGPAEPPSTYRHTGNDSSFVHFEDLQNWCQGELLSSCGTLALKCYHLIVFPSELISTLFLPPCRMLLGAFNYWQINMHLHLRLTLFILIRKMSHQPPLRMERGIWNYVYIYKYNSRSLSILSGGWWEQKPNPGARSLVHPPHCLRIGLNCCHRTSSPPKSDRSWTYKIWSSK